MDLVADHRRARDGDLDRAPCSPASDSTGCRVWIRPNLRTATAGAIPANWIHIDIKKLGRFDRPGLPAHRRQGGYGATYRAGWDYVHVAVDDTSRLAYAEILDNETGLTCVGFLRRRPPGSLPRV